MHTHLRPYVLANQKSDGPCVCAILYVSVVSMATNYVLTMIVASKCSAGDTVASSDEFCSATDSFIM